MALGGDSGSDGSELAGVADFRLGDRRSELVLIGHRLDRDKLRRCLEACLVTDAEIASLGVPGLRRDQVGWCALPDPFELPEIDMFTMAKFLDSQGRSAESLEMFQEVLAASAVELGDSVEKHVGLGSALSRLGDNAAAIEAFRAALRLDPDNTSALCGLGSIDVAQRATVHAGLLLRGNRCVLYRSMESARPHMRVPFVIHDEEEATGGAAGGGGGAASGGAAAPTGRRRGRLIAMREISDLCEIDAEEEVVPLLAIPPVTIFKPCGEPVVLILHALYAVNPPPSSTSDDGLLAEDPEWDEDYTYDWYTFPRAIAALKECGDQATIVALQSLAYALKGAAMAGVLPMKWGGVFGQEFAGGADGEDAASSPPCEEEECHAKAKAAPPSSP